MSTVCFLVMIVMIVIFILYITVIMIVYVYRIHNQYDSCDTYNTFDTVDGRNPTIGYRVEKMGTILHVKMFGLVSRAFMIVIRVVGIKGNSRFNHISTINTKLVRVKLVGINLY
jgi:hypothetical protein